MKMRGWGIMGWSEISGCVGLDSPWQKEVIWTRISRQERSSLTSLFLRGNFPECSWVQFLQGRSRSVLRAGGQGVGEGMGMRLAAEHRQCRQGCCRTPSMCSAFWFYGTWDVDSTIREDQLLPSLSSARAPLPPIAVLNGLCSSFTSTTLPNPFSPETGS